MVLNFMENWNSLLLSERGEVPDPTAQAPDGTEGTGEVETAADLATDTSDTTQADATQGDAKGDEDTFLKGSDLDPRKLPPELQPIFKRMQGVYTKKFQDFSTLRQKADVVDKFYADQNFARETLIGWAAQNGYQLTPINGANASQGVTKALADPGAQGVPPQLVEAFKQELAPELQWMAPSQAAATWKVMQNLLAPVLKSQEQGQAQARQQEYEKYADELRSVAPGWEEHEDVMTELHDFLKSDQMFHPRYGSKIQMVYDLATKNGAALKQATDRVNAAAKNRVSSGRSGGTSSRPSITDQIAKAKSSDDAFKLAAQHALSTVGRK